MPPTLLSPPLQALRKLEGRAPGDGVHSVPRQAAGTASAERMLLASLPATCGDSVLLACRAMGPLAWPVSRVL